jgi:S-adenosylmethionine:tRNA ribosyltransferase-isomerase
MPKEQKSTIISSKELDNKTLSYDYHLPKELIATTPAKPADSAKLLVYNRANKTITHSHFSELLEFIPKDTAIFLNDTKVIKARLFGTKKSGGKIELLLLKPLRVTTLHPIFLLVLRH